MYKSCQLRPQNVVCVEIKTPFAKVHSNLYEYREGEEVLEFVGNVTPAVGGFIVITNNEPPVFVPKEEFHQKYEVTHVG